MKTKLKFFVFLSVSAGALGANAQQMRELQLSSPLCRTIEVEAGPENLDVSHSGRSKEVWCFAQEKKSLAYFLFKNVEQFEPGTLYKIKLSKNEPIEFTDLFLLKSKVSSLSYSFKDFFPAALPFNQLKEMVGEYLTKNRGTAKDLKKHSLRENYWELLTSANKRSSRRGYQFVDPESEQLDFVPWVGFLWSMGGNPPELSANEISPITLYDRFVQAHSGTNPNAQGWETDNHSGVAVAWGGHCNSWAASSVIYEEPTRPLWDTESQLAFRVAEIKGIMAEASFCVNWNFYGRRNNDQNSDGAGDIAADLFHRTLIYYIKHQEKPVAYDYVSGYSVDNNLITGYNFNFSPIVNNEVTVTARLRTYRYHNPGNLDRPGPAPGGHFNDYSYVLTLNDSHDEILGGRWISGNPDFLWVPLSQSDCGRENPRMRASWVDRILELPQARVVRKPVNYSASFVSLNPEESYDINMPIEGIIKNIYFRQFDSDRVRVRSISQHPYAVDQVVSREERDLTTGATNFAFSNPDYQTRNLLSLRLLNPGSTPISIRNIRIEAVDVLAGD